MTAFVGRAPDPVAIVGGGAGGLAVAVALASRGVPSRVFERSFESNEIDRGDIIHFGSRRLLLRWGAWDAVLRRSPLPFTDFRILDGDGRRLLALDTAALLGPEVHLNALRHRDIVAALRATAASSSLVELHDAEPVASLETESGRVIGVRTGRARYTAPITVIATGTRSKLRDQHFGKPAEHDYNRSFFNCRVKALDRFRSGGCYVLDKLGVLIMVSLPHDELRIGVQFVSNERTARPFEDDFADWAGRVFRPLQRENLEVLDGHTYRLRSTLSPRWSIPGAVLLGDAAHTVHPTGGQGMNLAFGDADLLAQAVSGAWSGLGRRGSQDLDAPADAYAAARLTAVRPVHRRAHLGGLAAGLTHPAALAGRTAAVRLLGRMPPLQRQIFSRIVDVR